MDSLKTFKKEFKASSQNVLRLNKILSSYEKLNSESQLFIQTSLLPEAINTILKSSDPAVEGVTSFLQLVCKTFQEESLSGRIQSTLLLVQLFNISFQDQMAASNPLYKYCNDNTQHPVLQSSQNQRFFIGPLPPPLTFSTPKIKKTHPKLLELAAQLIYKIQSVEFKPTGTVEWKIQLNKLYFQLHAILTSKSPAPKIQCSMLFHSFKQQDLKLSKNSFSLALNSILLQNSYNKQPQNYIDWCIKLSKSLLQIGSLQRKMVGMHVLTELSKQVKPIDLIIPLERHQLPQKLMNNSNHIEVTRRALPLFLYLFQEQKFQLKYIESVVQVLLQDQDSRKLLQTEFFPKLKQMCQSSKASVIRKIHECISLKQYSQSELTILSKLLQLSVQNQLTQMLKQFLLDRVVQAIKSQRITQDLKKIFINVMKFQRDDPRHSVLTFLYRFDKPTSQAYQLVFKMIQATSGSISIPNLNSLVLQIITGMPDLQDKLTLVIKLYRQQDIRRRFTLDSSQLQFVMRLSQIVRVGSLIAFCTSVLDISKQEWLAQFILGRVKQQKCAWNDSHLKALVQFLGKMNESYPPHNNFSHVALDNFKGLQQIKHIIINDQLNSTKSLCQFLAYLLMTCKDCQSSTHIFIKEIFQAGIQGAYWLLLDSLISLSMEKGPQHQPHYRVRKTQKTSCKITCYKRDYDKITLTRELDQNLTLWDLANQACMNSAIDIDQFILYDSGHRQFSPFDYFISLKQISKNRMSLEFIIKRKSVVKERAPLLEGDKFTKDAQQAFNQIFHRYSANQFLDEKQCTNLVKDCVKQYSESYLVRNYVSELFKLRSIDPVLLHISEFKQFFLNAAYKSKHDAIWTNLQQFGYNSNLKLKWQPSPPSIHTDFIPLMLGLSIQKRAMSLLASPLRNSILDKLPTLKGWQQPLPLTQQLQQHYYQLQIIHLRLDQDHDFQQTFTLSQQFTLIERKTQQALDLLLKAQLPDSYLLLLLLQITKFTANSTKLRQDHLKSAASLNGSLFQALLQQFDHKLSEPFMKQIMFSPNLEIRQSICKHFKSECNKQPELAQRLLAIDLPSSSTLNKQFLQLAMLLILQNQNLQSPFLDHLLDHLLIRHSVLNKKAYQIIDLLSKDQQTVLQKYFFLILEQVFPNFANKDFNFKFDQARTLAYINLLKHIKLLPERLEALVKALSVNLVNIQPDKQISFKQQRFAGLSNLGATCYMNSALQQFFYVDNFLKGIIQSQNSQQALQQPFLKELKSLMAQLKHTSLKAVNTTSFCQEFKDHQGNPVNPRIQQDAPQFINRFFDKLQHALKDSPNKQLVQQIFGGTTLTIIKCKECGSQKKNQQKFLNISVQVKLKSSLSQSLDKFIFPQTIQDYMCQNCEERRTITKSTLFNQTPPVFIIQLQRMIFDMEDFLNKKIHTSLEFPFTLDLQNYKADHTSSTYYLRGVIIHSGTAEFGHYFSLIKIENKWFKFDDSTVTEFNQDYLAAQCFGGVSQNIWSSSSSSNAYILFYDKDPNPKLSQFSHQLFDKVRQKNISYQIQKLLLSSQFLQLCKHVLKEAGQLTLQSFLKIAFTLQSQFDLDSQLLSRLTSKQDYQMALEFLQPVFPTFIANLLSLTAKKRNNTCNLISQLLIRAQLKDVDTTPFLDLLFAEFKGIKEHWRRFNQYFLAWYNIILYDFGLRYALDHQFLAKFADLALQADSPLNKNQPLGNQYQQPQLTTVLHSIAHIGMQLLAPKSCITRDPSRDQQACLQTPSLTKLLLKEKRYNPTMMSLVKLLIKDKYQISQQLCNYVLTSLNTAYNPSEFRPFIRSASALLQIKDSLQKYRLTWLLGYPQLKLRQKDCPSMLSTISQRYYFYQSALHKTGCQSILNLLLDDKSSIQLSENSVFAIGQLANLIRQDIEIAGYINNLPPSSILQGQFTDWFLPELKAKLHKTSKNQWNSESIAQLYRVIAQVEQLKTQRKSNQQNRMYGRITEIQYAQSQQLYQAGISINMKCLQARGVTINFKDFPKEFLDQFNYFNIKEIQGTPYEMMLSSKSFYTFEKQIKLPVQRFFYMLIIQFQGKGAVEMSLQQAPYSIRTRISSPHSLQIQVSQGWRSQLSFKVLEKQQSASQQTQKTQPKEKRQEKEQIECRTCTLINEWYEQYCVACGMPLSG